MKTYMYSMTHKTTNQRATVPVWAACETTAFKAITGIYGSSFDIGSYVTTDTRYYAGISCD